MMTGPVPVIRILLVAVLIQSCRSLASFPIDEPKASLIEDRLVGKWKMVEDTNKNNFYAVSKREDPAMYHIKFWNRGGTNPTYEVDAHLSDVRGYRFLNIPYKEAGWDKRCYFFLRLLEANNSYDSLTTCIVADTTMMRFESSSAVKKHIRHNLGKAAFYSDTAHFYKMK